MINVLTRPVTEQWSGSSAVSLGEPSGPGGRETQLGAYAAGPLLSDRVGLRLFGDYSNREATPSVADSRISGIEGRRAASGGATLSWTPDASQRVDVSLQRSEDLRKRYSLTAGPPHLRRPEWNRDDVVRQQLDAHYRGDFSGFSLEGGIYRSSLDRENTREISTASAGQSLTDDIAEARVRSDLGMHALLVGAELRREALDDGTLVVTGRESANRRAVYVQDRIDLPGTDLSLTLGLRADNHEDFGTAYSPRAYLVWHADDRLTLRGGYGEGFKAPTLKQLSTQFSSFGGGGRFEITGNPQLKPETSRNAEVGALYQQSALRLEATVFENRLRDLVQTLCVENCGAFGTERRTYVNVAEARIRGLETGVSHALPLGFDASLNYTYLDARDRETQSALLERARHSASARLGWEQGRWAAHLRAQRIGSQLRQVGASRETLPHYTLLHAGVAFTVNDAVTLRLGVENLGDERLHERSGLFGYDERRRFVYFASNMRF